MLASSSITLLPGTNIKLGAKFRADIASQSPNASYPQFISKQRNPIVVPNNINLTLKVSSNNLNLELSIKKDCQSAIIRIYDILGHLQQVIYSEKNLSSGDYSFDAKIDKLTNGVYLLVTQVDDESTINKFLKF